MTTENERGRGQRDHADEIAEEVMRHVRQENTASGAPRKVTVARQGAVDDGR